MALFGLSCIFPTVDIKKTAEFYQKLGFSATEYLQCKEPHICLYCGNAEIILTQSRGQEVVPNRVLYGYGYDAYLYTDEQALLQEKCIAAGVRIARPLSVTDYHNSEFVIEDADGRWIAFGLKNKE